MKRLVIVCGVALAVLLLVASATACASNEKFIEFFNEGYYVGYEKGYELGRDEGYAPAYNAGYEAGRAEMKQAYEAGRAEMKQAYETALDETSKQAMFYFYYTPLSKQQYGITNLKEFLNRRQWIEGAYKPGIFDCGEMSAFLERYLENEGFHTKIITGSSPDKSKGKHAWLLVETSANKYTPVEATQWSVVSHNSPYFQNYFDYGLLVFEDIQEAIAYAPVEFDWWASEH